MAFAIPIIAAISGIAGAVSSVGGLFKAKEKPPQQQPLPVTPTVDAAKIDATAEIKKRRAGMLRAGGQTDITQGSAILNAGSVNTKSLLGA